MTCVDDTFPVNVIVSGLVTGTTLVLQNNGADDLSVTMPGTVAFPTSLTDGGAFEVTVKTQPTGPAQTCNVTSGVGTIAGSAASITNGSTVPLSLQFVLRVIIGDRLAIECSSQKMDDFDRLGRARKRAMTKGPSP